ncbi:MAG: hypothetical protein ACR2O3_09440 [Rhizobiaceae bacterium]
MVRKQQAHSASKGVCAGRRVIGENGSKCKWNDLGLLGVIVDEIPAQRCRVYPILSGIVNRCRDRSYVPEADVAGFTE